METRANHFLIGLLVLGLSVLIVNFFLWMQGLNEVKVKPYLIEFNGSVSGLAKASGVLFNGVQVGKVKSITLDKEHHGWVKIIVNIDKDLPLRENSRATIAQQALTGYSAIQIIPGTKDSNVITAKDGQMPRIRADSGNQRPLSDAAPSLIAQAEVLLQRLNKMVANNSDDIRTAVNNVRLFTETMASKRGDMASIIDTVGQLSQRFDKIAIKFDTIATKLDGSATALNQLLDKDGVSFVNDAKEAAKSISSLAKKLETEFAGNSTDFIKLAKQNMMEFERFVQDGRRAAQSLDRVLNNIDQNPGQFLSGASSVPEYSSNQ